MQRNELSIKIYILLDCLKRKIVNFIKDTSVTVKAINKALIATIRTGNREFLAVYSFLLLSLCSLLKL
jgi:hypothetical protein